MGLLCWSGRNNFWNFRLAGEPRAKDNDQHSNNGKSKKRFAIECRPKNCTNNGSEIGRDHASGCAGALIKQCEQNKRKPGTQNAKYREGSERAKVKFGLADTPKSVRGRHGERDYFYIQHQVGGAVDGLQRASNVDGHCV